MQLAAIATATPEPATAQPTAEPTAQAATAEPTAEAATAEPTAEPAHAVEAPAITVEGSADYDGTTYTVGEGSTIAISWTAKGDVESYNIYLYDSKNNLVNSATGRTDTQITIGSDSFAPGEVYHFAVYAVPVGGTEADGQMSYVTLTRPAPKATAEPAAETTVEPTAEPTAEPAQEQTAKPTEEPKPTEKPTAEPTPEPAKLTWDQQLDAKSDQEHVTALQKKLVEWGWLSIDPNVAESAKEGKFDQATMTAVLNLQTYINGLKEGDSSFTPLTLIDPAAEKPNVGLDTLTLIMTDDPSVTFKNPEMPQ